MSRIHDLLLEAYAYRAETEGLDQARLADKLGVDKAVVSRRLSGASNLTERTLAETFWALDHELTFDAVPTERLKRGNASTEARSNVPVAPSSTIVAPAPPSPRANGSITFRGNLEFSKVSQ